MNDNATPVKQPRLATVSELPSKSGYSWLTQAAMRHLIFKATPRKNSKGEAIPTNGLIECGAIIKLGRKVLVDLDRFDQWVEQHRQA